MSRKMLPVVLPEGFDPGRDQGKLEARVRKLRGEQWNLATLDTEAGKAYFVAGDTVTTIVDWDGRKGAQLPADVRPGDGAKQATLLAEVFNIRYPGQGWVMTEFDPYLRQAVMERLDADELRAREALAAALGVKLWEVQVHKVDGGFDVRLPASYAPSRHDARIEEAVTTAIGRPGWYFKANAQDLTMKVREGALPTFPAVIPYPLDAPTNQTWSLPLGAALGGAGEPNAEALLNFDATSGLLVTGTSGSGKTVFVNCLIASTVSRGWELAVVDVPHKAVDFSWCRDFCRPGGWGCDSKEQAVTVLGLVYEEGQRRARLLAEYGTQKIQDLPDEVRPRPLLALVDEVTGLFALEQLPKGIPRDHPLAVEALEKNLVTQALISIVGKLAAEMRFTGIRVVLSTQMAQTNTGVGVPLKMNLANRVLLGSNPNDTTRGHALLDPRSVPRVPEWIRADKAAAHGAGVAELEGQTSCVVKGFYADVDELRSWLVGLAVPRAEQPEPLARDIARLVPSLADTGNASASRLVTEGGFGEADGHPDELKGAAKAAHALAVDAAMRTQSERDSTTGKKEKES